MGLLCRFSLEALLVRLALLEEAFKCLDEIPVSLMSSLDLLLFESLMPPLLRATVCPKAVPGLTFIKLPYIPEPDTSIKELVKRSMGDYF
jgi:hypothetical protein